jgi:hypothetical protein
MAPILRVIRDVQRELLRLPPPLSARQIRFIQSPAFTRSAKWARLRYDFMRDHESRCQCCGHGSADRVKVNVDHIHPRKTHPQLALSYANLQVLCSSCNRGKGNRDRTDWRYRSASVPSCPACHARMKRRSHRGVAFWGCSNFPRCRATRPFKAQAAHRRRRAPATMRFRKSLAQKPPRRVSLREQRRWQRSTR